MTDRYLFKAKRIDNGEWIEGYYSPHPHPFSGFLKDYIFAPYYDKEKECGYDNGYQIDENTLCQYTGLTDKNGNKIWENDVVFVTDDDGCSGQIDTGLGEIYFIEGLWYISGRVQNSLYDINKCFQIEVIGTKFDNPELLGG